jgi:hypothetical protein
MFDGCCHPMPSKRKQVARTFGWGEALLDFLVDIGATAVAVVRKAACRRLAETGCTAHQITAISGHLSLSEVQRYTKSVDQARLAREAMRTVQGAFPPTIKGTSIGKPRR